MNGIARRTYRELQTIRWQLSLPNRPIAQLFVDNGVPFQLLSEDGAALRIGESEILLTNENAPLIAVEWRKMMALTQEEGARWSNHELYGLDVDLCGLRFTDVTGDQVFILHEIFHEHSYGLISREPIQIIDIGANVGMASLYFARYPWVERIISFEPLAPTFRKAQKNLQLNPAYMHKITIHEFGLAGSDRRELVDYSELCSGSVGIRGQMHPAITHVSDKREEPMTLRRASSVLQELQLDPEMEAVLKIDCEGAEYEIIRDLSDAGILRKMSALMIEWHINGDDPLINILLQNGFRVLRGGRTSHGLTGMIYAMH